MSDKSILFLDDQRYMHELIRPALQETDSGYYFVRTVKDACDKLDSSRCIAMILCDIDLGGSSGFDFVEEVRERRKIANIPIVMLSQYDDRATVERALAAGADDYIIKPFKLQRIMEAIKLWVGLSDSSMVYEGLSREQARLARLTMATMGRSVQAAKAGEPLPFQQMRDNCLAILQAGHDADILSVLSGLKDKNVDIYLHSIKVSAYLGLMATDLGLGKDEILDAITAGLLHDIGMARVSTSFFEKKFLTEDESKQITHQHIKFAMEIIKEQPQPLPKIVGEIATLHHERLDGSGPLGILGKKLSGLVRAICIIDEFSENKSGPWLEPTPTYRIVEAIEENPGFDAELLKTFKTIVKRA